MSLPAARPLTPCWRWLLWLAGLGSLLAVAGALSLWPRRGAALLLVFSPEPVGVLATLYHTGFWLAITAALAALASVVVRFFRATGAERQQLKWLVYAVVVIVVGFPLPTMAGEVIGSELAADLVYAALVIPLPVAVGVAILRYRLYDIDRLINRTLVYGLLTALLSAVYAGVVLVLAQLFGGITAEPPSWAVAGATLAVAALFQPARRLSCVNKLAGSSCAAARSNIGTGPAVVPRLRRAARHDRPSGHVSPSRRPSAPGSEGGSPCCSR